MEASILVESVTLSNIGQIVLLVVSEQSRSRDDRAHEYLLLTGIPPRPFWILSKGVGVEYAEDVAAATGEFVVSPS